MTSRIVAGLFLLLFIPAGTALAQIQASVKAGLNFATVSGDFDVGAHKNFRVGGVFGGGVSVGVTDMIRFEPDILYSMEGIRVNIEAVQDGPDYTAQLDYLRIPLLLRLSPGPDARGYVLVGPSVGFLVKKDIDSEADEEFQDDDLEDAFKDVDFGIVIGAGFSWNRTFLEGRYNIGLTNINDENGADEKNRNQVISALVGMRF
jgi:hypothetical protein